MGRDIENCEEEQGVDSGGIFPLSQSTKEVIQVYVAVSLITLLAATITFLKIFLIDAHSDKYSYLFESNDKHETSQAPSELTWELGISTNPE